MDLVTTCKDKLQYFRIKELKDVLTQLGLSKQGKKQDLVDRILTIVADDQGAKMLSKRLAIGREQVARLVDDTYRKMQISGASDLATKPPAVSGSSTPVKPKEEIDDSFQPEMKIRCLCASSLQTESMVQCEDRKCHVWQHIRCVVIPEKPMEGGPNVPPQFYCELCRLCRADPFWLPVSSPLFPVKLMTTSVPTDGTNPVQGVERTFQLTRADKDMLSKPEYDVQAWCMLLNDKVIFRMQWPQYADLQINGMAVRAINRPGSQLLGANGRDDGPIITPFTRDGMNKISLTGCDARIFCVGVRLVKRRNLQQILNLIPKESDGERFEDALARVRRCVGGGAAMDNADSDSDLEVVADSFTINLRCPMSGSRMKVAGRFKPCAHMGCFDLDTFVEMQQRSRKWQCPICLKNYSFEHVVIDPYFNRITSLMMSCGEDTTEIEVKPDGSWRVKGDRELGDLWQWHSPDGSLCVSAEDVKPKVDTLKPVKQEGTTGLKLGIRKNSNGVWEVSKHEGGNNCSSSERLQENLLGSDPKVIPMSSSATGSGARDGEAQSVNQSANGNFDLSSNVGVEFDSMSLNFNQLHGVAHMSSSVPAARDADVIVLSDSDDENDNLANQGQTDAGHSGVDFSIAPHGISDSFQNDPAGIGAGGSLDLFNAGVDDFSMSMWPLSSSNQAGSGFELFGSDAGVADPLADIQHNSLNLPTSMNGYSLAPEAAVNANSFVPHPSIGHSSHHDLNDGLVDNPMAFGGEDPSLQIFLPTKPSESSSRSGLMQQDTANGLQTEDWISLRLGGGSSQSHGESAAGDGFTPGYQLHSNDGAMQSLAQTASLFMNDAGSERTRLRSDSPLPFPHHRRSVKPRLLLSIDSDSE